MRNDLAERVSRHQSLTHPGLLSEKTLAVIGVGGVIGAIEDIAAMGMSKIVLVDPGRVEPTNIGTSRFHISVGAKVEVAAERIKTVNPECEVVCCVCHDDQLSPHQRHLVWEEASVVWSMTDDVLCHARCNQLAFQYKKDTLFGAVHGDNRAYDVIGSLFPESYQGSGCYRCHARQRVDAHLAGRSKPDFFPSHRLTSNIINDVICWVTLGLIHYRAGSDLWIARYGEEFAKRPCLLGLLDIEFWGDESDPFGTVPFHQKMFATRLYERPKRAAWNCPDCGR